VHRDEFEDVRPARQPESGRGRLVRPDLAGPDQIAPGLAAGSGDDLREARARTDRIGDRRRLDKGAPALIRAQEAAPRQGREGAAHGMAVDPVAFRELRLARQLVAGRKLPAGNAGLDVVRDLTPCRQTGAATQGGMSTLPTRLSSPARGPDAAALVARPPSTGAESRNWKEVPAKGSGIPDAARLATTWGADGHENFI
jgi:hypothetical protein